MIASLLMVAAVALQTSEVTEPNTQVKFPTELQAPSGGGPQGLAGTGVRTRTFLKVKVYAFGLYVDAAGARTALAAWRGKSAADLGRDPSLYTELLKGSVPMTLRLVMTRDVGSDQMGSAFEEALSPRMTGNTEALARFRALFTTDLKKGTELLFARSGSTLKVTIGGQVAGEIDNAVLGWALFDVYLGTKPISKEGKETILDRLPEVLGS